MHVYIEVFINEIVFCYAKATDERAKKNENIIFSSC